MREIPDSSIAMLIGMTDDLTASPWLAGDDARAAGRLILQLKCAPPTFIYDLLLVNRSPAGSATLVAVEEMRL